MKEIAMQAQVSSSFKLEKTAFTKKLVSAYFNIFEYTVTRLLPLSHIAHIKNLLSHTMCTNLVILTKITTKPPKMA